MDPKSEQQATLTVEAPPSNISPSLSLELRLRWLEALLLGVRQDAAAAERRNGGTTKVKSSAKEEENVKLDTLYRRVEDVQRRLDMIVGSNDGLRRFMEHYDRYAQFLTPSFALSGLANASSSKPPSYASMSSAELDAFLAEMEGDIRAADRDLREIDALEQRGATAAGKLADHEALQSRLQALIRAHEEDLAKAVDLERRIVLLLKKHSDKVDALSELFVAWNDAVTEAEDRVHKAEKEKNEQRRLGLA